MRTWIVPVTIVEYGRLVEIEAESASEAARKARTGDWLCATDANRFDVRVSGKIAADTASKGTQRG